MSKSEIRNSKSETNPNAENLRIQTLHWSTALKDPGGMGFLNLFRIRAALPHRRSGFDFRIRISQNWTLPLILVMFVITSTALADSSASGLASWYGEEHRGKLMANGQPFDPDKLTAASWSFPLGAKVRVTFAVPGEPAHSVVVTITDRGPNPQLVRQGRIIDLSYAAFKQLASPGLGLIQAKTELAKASP